MEELTDRSGRPATAAGGAHGATCLDAVRRIAAESPERTAVLAPGRPELSFARLVAAAEAMAEELARLGPGHGARFGTVLPDGPEALIVALAVTSLGACCPVNPRLTETEHARYLPQLRLTALIAEPSVGDAAVTAARELGLPVVSLEAPAGNPSPPGSWHLDGPPLGLGPPGAAPEPTDVAYAMHTSGTTGTSKVVPLTHANVRASLEHVAQAMELTPADRCLNVMPMFHAHGLLNTSMAVVVSGGSVVCTPGFAVPQALEWMREFTPTWYSGVPAMHAAVLDSIDSGAPAPTSLRFVRSSSSPLPLRLHEDLERRLGVPVIQGYGMTEASAQVAINPLPPRKRKAGTVGLPAGPEVVVLDEHGEPVETGAHGEIAMRGANVTPGYEHAPELNADRITADGWLRTGDRGTFDEDGYLTIVGREKEMINRGGEMLAPREIEEQLRDHPDVRDAVVYGVDHPTLGEEVAAAVVWAPGSTPDEQGLRSFVAAALSPAKVPKRLRAIDSVPRGPTGKPARAQLVREFATSHDDVAPASAASESPVAREVRTLWADATRQASPAPDEDFCMAGGDSLAAVRIVHAVQEDFGVSINPAAVLDELHTLRRFTEEVESALLARETNEPLPRPGGSQGALSRSQQQLWFVHQLAPEASLYHIPAAYRLRGPLGVQALAQALDTVVARHEVLRTSFEEVAGVPTARVQPATPGALEVVDLRDWDRQRAEVAVEEKGQRQAREPFDLRRGPLLRAALLRLAADEAVLLLTLHHIVADRWSIEVLGRELREAYGAYAAGHSPELPELPVQYGHHSAWEHERISSDALESLRAYWLPRLEQSAPTELIGDAPAASVTSFAAAVHRFRVDGEVMEALRRLAQARGTTLHVVLMSAFCVLLARWTGERDLVIGGPVAGRHRPETANLIGYFVNNLVYRVDASPGPSFEAFMDGVREGVVGALRHQDLPFDQLVADLAPEREILRNPLYRIAFQFVSAHETGLQLDGVDITEVPVDTGVTHLDLYLALEEEPDGLHGRLTYRTELLSSETAARFCEHLAWLLGEIVRAPTRAIEALSLEPPERTRRRAMDWNATDRGIEHEGLVIDLFAATARARADEVAVVQAERQATYGELLGRAERIASALAADGLRPGDRVGVMLEPSIEQVAAVLGAWQGDLAYLPLDPEHPPRRTSFVLEDAGVVPVLTTAALADRLSPGTRPILVEDILTGSASPPEHAPLRSPEQPAVVLYTSGSTGRPKGAVVPQRGLTNLESALQALAYGGATRPLQVALTAPLTFDMHIPQLLRLLRGDTVHIVPTDVVHEPGALVDYFRRHRVDAINCTPTLLSAWIRAGLLEPGQHTPEFVLFGGEPVDTADWDRLASSGARATNLYGPTECTVDATGTVVGEGQRPHIGWPLQNTRAFVVDQRGRPLPPGVPGELVLAGAHVGHGYIGRAGLTAERFAPDPLGGSGDRRYCTGDVVRWRSDGAIEFLGREDEQIKIRGVRIECGEIAATLSDHPSVARAAVIADDRAGERRLVAYYEAADPAPTVAELHLFLAGRLPAVMVPQGFMRIERLPLTDGGKIDGKALPQLDWTAAGRDVYAPPADPVEQIVASTWEAVLATEAIGRHDNFFQLGGNSLLATQVVARLREGLGKRVEVRWVFDAPTVTGLADRLRFAEAGDVPPPILPRRHQPPEADRS